MRVKFSDEIVGKFDNGHSFVKGPSRFCMLDGDELSIEMVHFDKGNYVCTKMALDHTLRDPQGRCYDCDQRGEEPKQNAVCNILGYRINDLGHGNYPPDNVNLYWVDFIRMGGKRIEAFKMALAAMGGDVRLRDIIFNCEDAEYQKGAYVPQMEAWWMHGRDLVAQLWQQKRHSEAALEDKLGKRMSYDMRVKDAIAKQQKQAGVQPAQQVNVALSVASVQDRMAQQGAVWGMGLPTGNPTPGVLPGIGQVLPGGPTLPGVPMSAPLPNNGPLAGLGGLPGMNGGAPSAADVSKQELDDLLAKVSGGNRVQ